MRKIVVACALGGLLGSVLRGQESVVGPVDPLRFSQLKDFVAKRSSSNNPDPNSNDDSKRPIPGETITLADLKGTGIVTQDKSGGIDFALEAGKRGDGDKLGVSERYIRAAITLQVGDDSWK